MSAYGSGAPSYRSAEVQKQAIDGRLRVAIGIRDNALKEGDQSRHAKWVQIVDELLARRAEVMG